MQVPCGRCIGCRLDYASGWATRMMHEASLHQNNCFITLTYNQDHLPRDTSLDHSHFQLFMKRLRKYIAPQKIKYYMCGEYGDKNGRPHYHAILFGYNFDDWIYLHDSEKGNPIYTSPTLERIWQKGFVQVGEVTYDSCAYVARYVMKKINGKQKDEIDEDTGLRHYERYEHDDLTGEVIRIVEIEPEYSTMSRGGRSGNGIAHDWINTYASDIYPKDHTHINGMPRKSTRYYDNQLKRLNPDMYDDIKAERARKGYESQDNSPERLEVRENLAKAKNKRLIRSL